MTGKAEWLALAERCEKATGPDREIDAQIQGALENWTARDLAYVLTDIERTAGPNHYTASLDAITALIEREFPKGAWYGGNGVVSENEPVGGAGVYFDRAGDNPAAIAEAATVPLAFCAAFCRAMAAKAGAP